MRNIENIEVHKNNGIKNMFENVQDYFDTKIDLIKLKAVEKVSESISSIASGLVIMVILTLFFILLNIGLALWIGEYLGKIYYGFLILSGFYGLVGLIFYLSRDKWLKSPIQNGIINKILN